MFVGKEEDNLDDSWINDFEKNDKPYTEFYKDDIYTINMNIVYVNKSNDIEKVTEEVFFMQNPNIISREEIIGIIKKKSVTSNNNYSLLSLIKYNITLNPEDINIFLKSKNFDHYNDTFFSTLKNIDTISFNKSIVTFQDLNTLFLVFYEKEKVRTNDINNTKKIYLRRRLNSKNRKTCRA
jgi:hypothetical protein